MSLMPSAERALKEIEEIKDLIVDLPERAAEFGDSCYGTLDGISKTVTANGFVTQKQERAIANIREGVEKWLHR